MTSFEHKRKSCFNSKLKSPCRECSARKPACSDHCERFKEFKETTEKMNKWLKDDKNLEYYGRMRARYTETRRRRKSKYGKY